MSKIFLTFTLSILLIKVDCQIPFYNKTYTPSSLSGPFQRSTTTSKVQWIYGKSDFTGIPAGSIKNLYLQVGHISAGPNDSTFLNDLTIKMGFVFIDPLVITPFFLTNQFVTGLTTVFSEACYVFPPQAISNWIQIPLETPFLYDSLFFNNQKFLVIEVSHKGQNMVRGGFSFFKSGSNVIGNLARTLSGTTNSLTGTLSIGPANIGFDYGQPGPSGSIPCDRRLDIYTGSLISSSGSLFSYCVGQYFSLSGKAVANPYYLENDFTLQLSDVNGAFDSPQTLATDINESTVASFYFNLPIVPYSHGYKLRILSNNPQTISGTVPISIMPTISAFNRTSNTFCPGSSVSIGFNVGCPFYQGNVFSLQLSDAVGNFNAPTILGTLNAINSNSISNGFLISSTIINGTLPANLPQGTYKLRIVSSEPIVISNPVQVSIPGPTCSSPLSTGAINGSPFCPGTAIQIPYSCTQTLNPNNIFFAELSDAQGNFSSPFPIGSILSNVAGTITGHIPVTLPEGQGYRIRVVSNDPTIIGDPSPSPISITKNVCDLVRDLKINPLIGTIDTLPFQGVMVEARLSNSPLPEATTTTDNGGRFFFPTLDSNTFYNLTFYFQDPEGILNNIYSEIKYAGYKLGDKIKISMPYSMLLQTRQMARTIQLPDPPSYEIEYLTDQLQLTQTLPRPRQTYMLDDISSLIDDWQSIEQFQDPQLSNDIINNLGRVYISLYANREFSNDAYQLCKEPPKAISEFVATILELIKAAQEIKAVVFGNTELEELLGKKAKQELIDNLQDFLIGFLLDVQASSLKVILETQVKPEEKATLSAWVNKIKEKLLAIISDNLLEEGSIISIDDLQELAKEMLNNEGFVFLYERYINETQHWVDRTYQKANLLAPPTGSFEEASNKIYTTGTSLVPVAHEKTEQLLFANSLLFDNSEQADLAAKLDNALGDLVDLQAARTGGAALRAAANIIKRLLFLFEAFKSINYGVALYNGINRLFHNSLEQGNANIWVFNPSATVRQSNAIQSNGLQPQNHHRSQPYDSLSENIFRYNLKMDSIISLLQTGQNSSAFLKGIQLYPAEMQLGQSVVKFNIRMEALAKQGIDSVIHFDSVYTNYVQVKDRSAFLRKSIVPYFIAWIGDTTSTGFLDTLNNALNEVKIQNLHLLNEAQVLDSITENMVLSKRIKITGISGENLVPHSTSTPITVNFKNFGTQTVDSIWITINAKNGFILTQDSIFVDSIQGNIENSVIFNITSPSVDSFTLITITITARNAEGDFSSDYLITKHCSKFPPFSDFEASANSPVCRNQPIQLVSSNIDNANYTWSGPNLFSSSNQNPVLNNAQVNMNGIYTATVTANGCSVSDTAIVNVISTPQPGEINGMVYGICKNSTHTYSIPANNLPVVWTVPPFSEILIGQNTHTVTVHFKAQFSGGVLSVVAFGNCGQSDPRELELFSIPSQPSSITGPSTVCKGGFYTYSIESVPGASFYDWKGPGGSQITGDGTNVVCIKFGNSPGGIVKVRAMNECGYSDYQVLNVTSANCNGPASCSTSMFTKGFVSPEDKPSTNNFDVLVNPNPSRNYFNVEIVGIDYSQVKMNIYDMNSKLIQSKYITGVNNYKIGENLQIGVYIVEFIHGDRKKVIKLIKSK